MSDLGEAPGSSKGWGGGGWEGCAVGMFQLNGMVFKQFALR